LRRLDSRQRRSTESATSGRRPHRLADGDRRYGASHGSAERAYAIDVDGAIVTFFSAQPATLLAADRGEFQRFLDSIRFEPAR
jgi:hypothetical protein